MSLFVNEIKIFHLYKNKWMFLRVSAIKNFTNFPHISTYTHTHISYVLETDKNESSLLVREYDYYIIIYCLLNNSNRMCCIESGQFWFAHNKKKWNLRPKRLFDAECVWMHAYHFCSFVLLLSPAIASKILLHTNTIWRTEGDKKTKTAKTHRMNETWKKKIKKEKLSYKLSPIIYKWCMCVSLQHWNGQCNSHRYYNVNEDTQKGAKKNE